MASNIESKGEVQTGKGSTDNAALLHAKLTEGLLISPNNASSDCLMHSTANLHKMEIVDHSSPPGSGKVGGAPPTDDGHGQGTAHTGGGEAGAGAAAGAAERGARAAARAAAEAAAGIGRR